MNIDDLKRFCAPDHEKMGEPWSEGEFTYASNGHILVRVARFPEVTKDEGADIERILACFGKEPKVWFPISPVTAAPDACPRCKGAGKVYTCPECEGEGEAVATTDFNEYEVECQSCGGQGQLTKEKWLNLMSGRLKRRQATEEDANCFHCNGTGKVWGDSGDDYGEAYFAHRLLAMVADLPGIEIGPFSEFGAARLRFEGGEGLIMPRRRP